MKPKALFVMLILWLSFTTIQARSTEDVPDKGTYAKFLLVGCYMKPDEEGVRMYRFDGQTADVDYPCGLRGISNPAFLTSDSTGNRIYAIGDDEGKSSTANALLFDKESGLLSLLNSQSTDGELPIYITLSPKEYFVLTANYKGGSITVFSQDKKGKLQRDTKIIRFAGNGPNKKRQEQSHLHCVTFTPDGKFLLATDLKVCQNAHLLFLCTKPRLSQAGALLLPKDFVSLSITFYTMTKIHFRPYNPNQTVLFPPRIDEDIAEHDPVRMVDALVESLNLESFRKLYKECGRSPYHPRMMLKVILYAYMNNIYSCRKIEKLLHRDIHYIWLAGYEKPDFITINRFRNRVKNEINEVFTQTVLLLSSKGFISLNVEYIDGTKIESKANKYTFVWRKTVERNRERLMKKIHILLGQIDNVIAQENSSESNEEIEFTPAMLTEMAGELRQALEQVPEPSTKEEKTALKKKRKQLKELEEHRDKLQEYDNRLDTLQDRNSYSKTDNDATFMRMKEDAMRNGQTKPGYNLQIGTGNQFITDFALFPNPTDTLTLIPFLQSFSSRYDRLAHTVVADSGYGSEENYRFMSENGMEAYVKYNYFHMEQRPRFKPDPFKAENFYYNEEQDFCICPMGQKMQRIGTRHVKTASGYVSENARYRAIRCEGCPLRCRCFKAKGNRTIELNHRLRKYKQKAKELLCSEEGLKHRGQRCIEPEAVFGQMKNNMNYKRFRHFGKDKVFMDFAFFAIAFNIKKMCAKMTKEGMDG